MKFIKNIYNKAAVKFYTTCKSVGWLNFFLIASIVWSFTWFGYLVINIKAVYYDVECYSATKQIYKAENVRVRWEGFHNIEVVDGETIKKIYGNCIITKK